MSDHVPKPRAFPRWLIWVFAGLGIYLASQMMDPKTRTKRIDYSVFVDAVANKEIVSVTIDRDRRMLWGDTDDAGDQPDVWTEYGGGDAVPEELRGHGARIGFEATGDGIDAVFMVLLAFILLIMLVMFFIRRSLNQGGPGRLMRFGQSNATQVKKEATRRYTDLRGMDAVIEEVRDIESFLKEPERYHNMGLRVPKGILLVGPPGCGKTLLAKAVAGEAGVPFYSISGSDFVEMFVGVGASRVRDLFAKGRAHAPCILFFDEIDAVGRRRGSGLGNQHDEREQTLNQILVEMDGFEPNSGIIVIAATNRADVLDPALLRAGRFDRHLVIDRPDHAGRLDILDLYLGKHRLADDIDREALAVMTRGFDSAGIENLVNETAWIAVRAGRETLAMDDFDEAHEKMLMGTARAHGHMPVEMLRRLCVHEIGHTLAGKLLKAGRFHKVTIVPRGKAVGFSMFLPDSGKGLMTESDLRAEIKKTLGGRVAELIVNGDLSTGASDDLKKATEAAEEMVRTYGMSSLGPVSYQSGEGMSFLGRDLMEGRNTSEATVREIDLEVRRLLVQLEKETERLLRDNLKQLHALADELAMKKTLNDADVEAVLERFRETQPS